MVSLQVEARRRDKFQHEYSIQARAGTWALVNPRQSQHLNEKCCSMFQDALTGSTLVSFDSPAPFPVLKHGAASFQSRS